jgi:hypothetical protein
MAGSRGRLNVSRRAWGLWAKEPRRKYASGARWSSSSITAFSKSRRVTSPSRASFTWRSMLGRSWPWTLANVGLRDRGGEPASARGRDTGWWRWSSRSDTGVLNRVWVSDLGVSVILATTPSLVSCALIKPGLLVYSATSCSSRRVACERSP